MLICKCAMCFQHTFSELARLVSQVSMTNNQKVISFVSSSRSSAHDSLLRESCGLISKIKQKIILCLYVFKSSPLHPRFFGWTLRIWSNKLFTAGELPALQCSVDHNFSYRTSYVYDHNRLKMPENNIHSQVRCCLCYTLWYFSLNNTLVWSHAFCLLALLQKTVDVC